MTVQSPVPMNVFRFNVGNPIACSKRLWGLFIRAVAHKTKAVGRQPIRYLLQITWVAQLSTITGVIILWARKFLIRQLVGKDLRSRTGNQRSLVYESCC